MLTVELDLSRGVDETWIPLGRANHFVLGFRFTPSKTGSYIESAEILYGGGPIARKLGERGSFDWTPFGTEGLPMHALMYHRLKMVVRGQGAYGVDVLVDERSEAEYYVHIGNKWLGWKGRLEDGRTISLEDGIAVFKMTG